MGLKEIYLGGNAYERKWGGSWERVGELSDLDTPRLALYPHRAYRLAESSLEEAWALS